MAEADAIATESSILERIDQSGWMRDPGRQALRDLTKAAAAGFPTSAVPNAQTDSYTLVLTDAGTLIQMNKATALNLTVPPNSSVAFVLDTEIDVLNYGAGQVTVVAGSGVTIRTPETLKLRVQYSAATLRKIGTDEWFLAGDLELAT